MSVQPPSWNEKGYIMGLGCQGRFGNQFDYLLGMMDYTQQLGDRTLVLAPWVDYNAGSTTGMYPWFPWFKEYFRVDTLGQTFHGGKVIDMADFLYHYRDRWAAAKSKEGDGFVGFCSYETTKMAEEKGETCMTYSVPKGPFWKNLNISFDTIYGPFGSKMEHGGSGPPTQQVQDFEHPVVAFECTPGKYPAPTSMDHLTQHLRWSDVVLNPAFDFIEAKLERPFIAVHFRTAFAKAGCGFSVKAQCGMWETAEAPLTEEVCTCARVG